MILSLDPSSECTGYAMLGADRGIIESGTIRPDARDKTPAARVLTIGREVGALVKRLSPGVVVVETPFATPRGGPKAKRSAMTLPTYGMAVGAALAAVDGWRRTHDPAPTLVTVPADEWSRGLAGTRDDAHKTKRVQAVAYLYQIDPSALGPKTIAGNVADAILMARWALSARAGEEGSRWRR